jgi:tyrocidine synthetase-3
LFVDKMKKLDKKSIENILALTPIQEGMLFHYLKDPEGVQYSEQLCLNISGQLDIKCFERAWDVVTEANEMLRTVFRWEKLEKPAQIILKVHKCNLYVYDLTGKNSSKKKTALEEIKAKDRQKTFDLRRVPFRVILCKIAENKYQLIISNHHILYDGWSTGIILREFFDIYHALSSGNQQVKPPAKPSFKEFIQWIRTQDKIKQKQFWKEYLADFESPTGLPIKKRKAGEIKGSANYSVILPGSIKNQLEIFIKEHRVTLASFFYSTWGILLQRYCNAEEVIFGTTVSGRSAPIKGIQDMVGLFINTIPLRIKPGIGEKVKDLLCRVNNSLPIREKYESTPLVDKKEYSQLENNVDLFDSLVVMENYPLDHDLIRKNSQLPLVVDSYSIVESSNYDLSISITVGEVIGINFIYNPTSLEKSSISRLSSQFNNIIEYILINPKNKISQIEILSAEEKKQILYDFNDTEAAYPQNKTIHGLFAAQAERTPDNIAVVAHRLHQLHEKLEGTGVLAPLSLPISITYKELERKSNQLAHGLKTNGVNPDTIVGLMLERSTEMIIGILGILKAGGAYLPIDSEYPQDRIDFMLKDSSAKFLVTAPGLSEKFEKLSMVNCQLLMVNKKSPGSRRLNIPANEASSHLHLSPWVNAPVTCLAYVIYTSGSTGKPKGVLVEHASVVNLAYSQMDQFDIDAHDKILQFSTICFDASVEQIFIALFSGAVLALIDKNTLLDTHEFDAFVSRHCITHIHAVPSFLSNMKLTDTSISTLKRIIAGGDICPAALAKTWSQYCDFYNEYGPTETTVTSIAMLFKTVDERLTRLPIGKPLNNTTAYLLDRWMRLVPLGVGGELYLGGDGVARGYLNRPELTAEKFLHVSSRYYRSYMSYMTYISKKIYKTGDLARWLPDGNMEFLGRMDQQVKIRGVRIEPEEIENQLLAHHQIKEAVVTARQDNVGDGYLAAYIVPGSAELTDPDKMNELRSHLSLKLPGYMIPSNFVLLERIPLTPSGKVDRKALPEPGITSKKAYVAASTETERVLARLWSEVLGIEREKISVNDNFFELGGHSLNAVGLIGRIHKVFSVKISITQLFKTPTVKTISDHIARAEASFYSPIAPVEEKEYYPLSPAQKRLFLVQQMNPLDISYHLTAFMVWDGPLERKRFEKAFRKLIERHQSLRTSFEIIAEEPMQKVHDQVELEIEFFDAERNGRNAELKRHGRPATSTLYHENTIRNFVRPFDLSLVPLMRVGLIRIEEENHILMFDMHHIISDGISMQIFVKEFTAFYQEEIIPGLRIQYKDFSHWQNALLDSGAVKKQEDYWLECFVGEIPVLNLPYDFPRPVLQTHEGSSLEFKITLEQTQQLKQWALESESTTFIVLLAVFNLLLSKLSGQEDIVVGSPAAGRRHPDLESLIGVYINTLALRNYPAADRSFDEFLAEVKKTSLDAYENQDYQYEELVEKVEPQRDLNRNPLFDVMLVVPNMEMELLNIPGIALRPVEYPQRTSKFDMTITAVEKNHQLDFTMTYSRTLFTEETIRRFMKYFKRVLAAVLKDIKQKIAEIDILADNEKKQLLYGFNLTEQSYSRVKTIHRLFEEQVEQTPDHIALVGQISNPKSKISNKFDVGHLSYRELNERANQLGQLLRREGVKRETITAIMMAPCPEMIIGILAVLKAGGAYLPIDPQQQAGRVAYMLNDSRAVLSLTQEHVAHAPAFGVPFLAIDRAALYKGEGSNLHRKSRPGDVLYTIYTSGTTGKSKGTLIEHKNLVNYVYWFREKVHLTERDRTVLTSSFSFDLGYTAIYPSILTGFQLHIIPRETFLSPGDLISYINQHGITYIKVTPSLFTTIVENSKFSQTACPRLRLVVLGGEEIKLNDVEKAHRIAGHLHFMNHYGPTEATIGCVAQFIDFSGFSDYRKRPTIGHPIHNMKVAILDNQLKLVPVGVPGELSVSGASVARGYLNQPELTAQKFLPDSHTFYRSYRSYKSYIYKTGDMARWTSRGAVEFLGRVDTQVKIRGYRIEPGEIENRLLTHEAINEAVVIPREHPSADKYLCAYIVLKNSGPINISALKEYLAVELPDYMIPSFFVELERIPLTPNGKLNRKLLPEPEMGALTSYYAAPGDPVEKSLAEMWQEILEVDRIGINDHFFQLGGHSLKAIILISRMNKSFHVNVPLAEIFRTPTIRGLFAYIKSKKEGLFTPIEPVEEKDYHALSPAQKRLYILHQMDEGGTGYNMPYALRLEGEVNKNILEEIFLRLIARHESLRTSFRMLDGVPVQRIHDEVEFKIEYYDMDEGTGGLAPLPIEPATALISSFIRPFDLSHAPLLRVALVKKAGKTHLLMVDMHHIISDGISRRLLVREFMALAAGKDLPPLRLQYKDFSEWQNSEAQREAQIKQKAYWKKQLGGEIPVLDLPIDYVRPTIQQFAGSTVAFEIDQEEVNALQSLALAEGMTLYMILIGIYYILLFKLSNQEDILVGTPTAGRRHADLQQIIGMFVNTLVLRNYPTGDKTYRGFLKEIKKRSLQAFENQDYPYEELVEEVAVTRDASRNPLFDTMFVMQNLGIPRIEIPGLKLTPDEHRIETSKFDLTLMGMEVGEKLIFTFEYSTRLFTAETIRRFIGYFNKIVNSIIETPTVKLADIEIISEEEKQQILVDFNNTRREYPKDRPIHEIFEEQVEQTPHRIALISRGQRSQLSYKELNEKSLQLARVLKEKGVGPNVIVGLMVDRSVEMIIGMYGILKAGGAYMPLAPDYPRERVRYMLEESGSRILITREKYLSSVTFEGEVLDLQDECLYSYPSGRNSLPGWDTSPEDLVYVIYTSGSTGKPRGVPIKTRGFVNLVNWYITEFDLNARDRFLLIAPISFDLTQKNLFAPLFLGGCVCLASPGLHDYDELSDFIVLEQQTVINCAPSVFYPFVGFNGHDGFKRLQSLCYVFLGGEPIRRDQLMPWLESGNCGCNIVNTYGPTECTDVVSFYRIPMVEDKNPCPRDIPIGGPVDNVTLYVLDNRQNLLPVGLTGEVCIGGIGVSWGYLNNPELTCEKFIRAVNGHSSLVIGSSSKLSPYSPHSPHSTIYKTGDLGRWSEDGNIEFLGRIDHQVKVRGLRIELGEIENQLLKHKIVKEAAVVAIADETRGNYLCGYIVANSPGALNASVISELKEHLSKHLPGYMIPGYFVELGALPLTPSGKVDRKALPLPPTGALRETYMAPQNVREEKLAEIWSEILGVKKERISINANFFELGGNSLTATILVSKIHKELNVKVPLAEIFKDPTISKLSAYIKNKREELYASIEPTEKKEYYTLSSVQKRLYALHQLDINSTVYNIAAALLLEGEVDKDKLDDIFRKLTQRHGSLRTSFVMVAAEPVQRVHDEVEFEIEFYCTERKAQSAERKEGCHAPYAMPYASTIKTFIRPFDLSCTSLLRVVLMKTGGQKYILLVDMHHIISDGISGGILVKEFMALAGEEKLPDLKLQYKDYSERQKGEKEREAVKEQENYWKRQFADEIPVLDLPTDFTRPAVQSFDGSHVTFEIGKETAAALKSLALAEGTTLYMVLLTIYNIFLSKLSSQEDIIVGTPTAGRGHPDLEPIIGMFVNTLVLRNYPNGEKSFPAFLKEIKERSLEAFDHQDYQYEDLVEQVLAARDKSRNPLFDTMLVIQNTPIPGIQVTGLKLTPFQYQGETSKFDLLLIGEEAGEKLSFTFEYSTRLFTADTIRRFIGYFNKIVTTVIGNPAVKLAEIEIISEEEKQQILVEFNNTRREYPREKTIHQLFEEQVEQTPDNTAAVGPLAIKYKTSRTNRTYISYRELNNKSNQLAYLLQAKGVKPDTIVGIMLERSLEMIIGILGILKTGAAYLPIDPDYPEERKQYMLKDSGTEILLKNNDFSHSTSTLTSTCQVSPTNLAYVTYTSGSTGKPKGVMVEHRNVVRLIKNTNYVEFKENQGILQTGALEFDASTFEIWGALLNGLTLYLVDKGQILNPERLKETIKRHNISTIWMTSPLFNQMVQADVEIFAGLTNLLVGGDALSPLHINKVRKKFPALKVINGYGPTENTTFSTSFSIDKEYRANIPIGSPIANSTVIIIDKAHHLQPVKVAGELCVGGEGVSRGYLNDPELTADKFIKMSSRSYRSYRSYIYKTGDLACWLPDGNIEFLGRIDHQVKLRGFRVEPGEIENRLLSRKGIKDAVVLVKQNQNQEKYLYAYVVPDSGYSPAGTTSIEEELRNHLQQTLPNYMVPAYFITLNQLPLTPNGKIDRKALPEPENIRTGKEYTAPRSDIENKLVEIWEEELGTAPIGIHDNFFDLGGHSLKAIGVVNKIQKNFGVTITVRDLFRFSTIGSMVPLIQRSEITGFQEIEKQPEKAYYELSYSQKRLWFIIKREPHNTSFNMPGMIALHEAAAEVVLRGVLQQLIDRHEGLRTYFKEINKEPAQVIEPVAGIKPAIEIIDLSGLEEAERQDRPPQLLLEESSHIFDLKKAPLFRVKLVKCKTDQYYLVFNMHHIISDGWSIEILKREFNRFYQAAQKGLANDMQPLEIQYKDYAAWQNQLLANEEKIKKAEEFWKNQLRGVPPVLNLPYDFPGHTAGRESAAYRWVIPGELTNRLREMGVDYRASLFMVLLAGFNILLSQVTGQEDILIAIPAAARQHEALKNIIGIFVNTLILQNTINDEESFAGFFKHFRDNTFKVLEYQYFPLELICGQLKIKYPTISVFFNMVNIESTHREELTDFTCYHQEKVQEAKFEMVCYLTEYKNGIDISCHYLKDRFKPISIEKLMHLYTKVLEGISREPHREIWRIGAHSEAGTNRIVKRNVIKREG